MPQLYVIYRPEDARKKSKEIITVLEKTYGAPNIQSPDYDGYLDVYAIEEAVKTTDFLLVIIGNYWADMVDESGVNLLNSVYDPVHMAIATAIQSRKQVIPILVDGASMPYPTRLPRELRKLATQEPIKLDKNAPVEKSITKGLKDIIKSDSRLKMPDFVQQVKLPQRTPAQPQQPRLRQPAPPQKQQLWVKRAVVLVIALIGIAMMLFWLMMPMSPTDYSVANTSNTDSEIAIQITAVPPTINPTSPPTLVLPTDAPLLPKITADNASQLTLLLNQAITISPTELVLFSEDQTLFTFLSTELEEVQIEEIATGNTLKVISTSPYDPIAIQMNADETQLLILLRNGQVIAWGVASE